MPPDPQPPSIPDYALLALIGRGSYGDVWLARGITGPHRAIKVVWRKRFRDDGPYLAELEGLQQFARVSLVEAGQLALLHVGHHKDAGFFYYVMEAADDAAGLPIHPSTYVPNTLAEALRRRGRVPIPQALAIGATLAEGLAGLHARGLVHRDIKPSNIIFVAGTAKLADIGSVGALLAKHTVSGTPGYVPPEGPGSAAADVFSLGKVLYETAMGLDRTRFPQLPPGFESLPDRQLLLQLNEVIIRACAPSPAARYPDGSSLLDALRELQAGPTLRTHRRPRGLTVGWLGAAAATGLACLTLTPLTIRECRRRCRELYLHTLGRAALALEQGDPARARQELLRARPAPPKSAPRGFEWYILWNDSIHPLQLAHPDPYASKSLPGWTPHLGVSPDGRWLAVAGAHTRIDLISSRNLDPLAVLATGARPAGFLPDDGIFLWAEDGSLHAWRNAAGFAELGRLGLGASVRSVVLAADGSRIAAIGAEGSLEIWDRPPRRQRRAVAAHPGKRITGLAISTRGRLVATWDEDSRLRLWQSESGAMQAEAITPSAGHTLAFSSDGSLLALVLPPGRLELRRTADLAPVRVLQAGDTEFSCLAFAPDGLRLLAGDARGLMYVYDTDDWEEIVRLSAGPGHRSVDQLVFSRDGRVLAAHLEDGSVRVWTRAEEIP